MDNPKWLFLLIIRQVEGAKMKPCHPSILKNYFATAVHWIPIIIPSLEKIKVKKKNDLLTYTGEKAEWKFRRKLTCHHRKVILISEQSPVSGRLNFNSTPSPISPILRPILKFTIGHLYTAVATKFYAYPDAYLHTSK